MIQNIAYLVDDGSMRPLPVSLGEEDRDYSKAQQWWGGGYGLRWKTEQAWVELFRGIPFSAFPTPNWDGVVILGIPEWIAPHNAAIYNADGSLRFHLKTPKQLTRHFPGYVHTADEVARLEPEGIWQVGWNTNDFGEICTWEAPYLMWAHIGLHCDVYERRYFAPDTGEFDMTHFHVARQ